MVLRICKLSSDSAIMRLRRNFRRQSAIDAVFEGHEEKEKNKAKNKDKESNSNQQQGGGKGKNKGKGKDQSDSNDGPSQEDLRQLWHKVHQQSKSPIMHNSPMMGGMGLLEGGLGWD